MKNNLLKFSIALLFFVSLSACDKTTNSPIKTNSEQAVDPNSLSFIIKTTSNTPLNGVVVQLNNDSVNTVTTGTDGVASFKNLADNNYDVHFFMPSSYTWFSLFSVKKGFKFDVVGLKQSSSIASIPTSYFSLAGKQNNRDVSNSSFMRLEYYADINLISGNIISTIPSNPNYSMKIATTLPVASTLSGDLWALEYNNDPRSNSTYLSDSVKYPNVELTTVAKNAVATQFDITLNASKPSLEFLTNINSMSLPIGFSQQSLSIYHLIQAQNNIVTRILSLYDDFDGSNFPLNINAYDPLNLAKINLSITSNNSVSGATLHYFKSIIKGENLNIMTNFDNAPQISNGQSGSTIRWMPTSGNISSYSIEITQSGNNSNSTLWRLITLDQNATEIVLPDIPPNVTTRLTTGVNYNIQFGVQSTVIDGNQSPADNYESIDLKPVNWTR